MAAATYPLSLILFVFIVSTAQPSFALFQTSSSPERALSVQEGSAVYVELNNLLADFNGSNSKWSRGFSFAAVQNINGKRIAIRYVHWNGHCTVGTWEDATGDLVLEGFKTTVPYLRPYLLQGYSWAAVSNRYAWLDYYLLDQNEARVTVPRCMSGQVLQAKSVSRTFITANHECSDASSCTCTTLASPLNITTNVDAATHAKLFCSPINMPNHLDIIENTGFVDCPVSHLVLLSHNNGVWDVLKSGEYLTSANKRMQLAMQGDCNLVLTDTQKKRELWSSDSGGKGCGCFLRLQSDGNLVIYNNNGLAVWAIDQGCGCGCVRFSSLVIENDGNLVLFRSENSKLNRVWETNTTVKCNKCMV